MTYQWELARRLSTAVSVLRPGVEPGLVAGEIVEGTGRAGQDFAPGRLGPVAGRHGARQPGRRNPGHYR
jgi:hypothetical protein